MPWGFYRSLPSSYFLGPPWVLGTQTKTSSTKLLSQTRHPEACASTRGCFVDLCGHGLLSTARAGMMTARESGRTPWLAGTVLVYAFCWCLTICVLLWEMVYAGTREDTKGISGVRLLKVMPNLQHFLPLGVNKTAPGPNPQCAHL